MRSKARSKGASMLLSPNGEVDDCSRLYPVFLIAVAMHRSVFRFDGIPALEKVISTVCTDPLRIAGAASLVALRFSLCIILIIFATFTGSARLTVVSYHLGRPLGALGFNLARISNIRRQGTNKIGLIFDISP